MTCPTKICAISIIQRKIGARACARRSTHDEIRKVWTFSFHWKKLLILNDSWWFWTILKTHEMIMNFWKTALSFLCIFYQCFGFTCHFWKTPQKKLNLQISIFSKIASFYPNLIIFFSSESWGFILFKFYHARTRARQNHIFWKFSDFGIFNKFPAFKVKLARACVRAGAQMIKFEKYELSAFTGKKN